MGGRVNGERGGRKRWGEGGEEGTVEMKTDDSGRDSWYAV